MIFKKLLLTLSLICCYASSALAQSSMTDDQVLHFMMRENARGTSRSEIVTSLIERGVQIEQIRRIRDKAEKQNNGDIVGARSTKNAQNVNSRLRNPNGDKRDLKGDNQRSGQTQKIDESTLSEKQLRI